MQAASLRYLELNSYFHGEQAGKSFPVTISQLTEVWHCTPRYVKQIVHHLSDTGWIEWKAGQGRGNRSELTLLQGLEDVLLREVKQRMEQGQVQESMDLMNRYGTESVKNRFMDWLSEGMGFSTKAVSDRLQDTLRLPVYRKIYTLDPGRVYYAFDFHLAGQLFNTLVKYDRDNRQVMPCIAHSWENSLDGLLWTFHLKKGVMFHHGRELNAEDVLFSLNRIRLQPDLFEAAWMLQDIQHMEAADHKTVNIRLRQPNHLLLRFLCTVPTSILPVELAAGDRAEFWVKPSGTGPFQLAQLNEGICVLEAFDAHFQGRPHLDRVEVLIFPDTETGRLKEPDWASVMSSQGDAGLTRLDSRSYEEGSDWCREESMFACSSLLVFNQWKQGPQHDPRFRQALHQIIDRQQLIAELGEDRMYPARGFRPRPNHLQDERNKVETEETCLSEQEIRDLLMASSYNGETFHLSVNMFHQEDAVWIAEHLEPFGIHVRITMEDQVHFGQNGQPAYDGRLFGATLETDEVGELEVYLQKNYFLTAYDEDMAGHVKKTAEAVFREPDKHRRSEMLRGLEKRIRQDHLILFLAHKKSSTAFHKSIRGVSINEYGWLDFHKIWIQPS